MPEGPEIRRAADRLAEAVVGEPLTAAYFAPPGLKKHERRLVGRRIEAIAPRGKALLTLDADTVATRLDDPRFRGRSLAALLLDQGFLAGMGNYLRSEVLFQAGIVPLRRPRDLDDDERARLADALLVPRRSYRTRGIAPTRGMQDDYLTDTPDGFRMRVFGRDGQRCERCGGRIERIAAAGRRLNWCPRCQR